MSKIKQPPSIDELIGRQRKRILAQFNFGTIKTYRDYLELGLGYHPSTIDYIYDKRNGSSIRGEETINPLLGETSQSTKELSGTSNGGTRTIQENSSHSHPQLQELLKKEQIVSLLLAEEWRIKHNQYDYSRPSDVTEIQQALTEIPQSKEAKGAEEIKDKTSQDGKTIHESIPQPVSIVTAYKDNSFHPKQKAILFKKQEEASQQLLDNLILNDYHGQLLLAAAGKGKTYILGAIVRRVLDHPTWLTTKSMAPWKIVYITKASIVEQTSRVLEQKFGIRVGSECIVINIEQLRAAFGDMFIEWKNVAEGGETVLKPFWKPLVYPCLFIWDECQTVKNDWSTQSQIAQAVNDIEIQHGSDRPVYQIFSSATPFTKVSEAKVFSVATRIPVEVEGYYGLKGKQPLTNNKWHSWARQVASPGSPEEHNEAAIERLISHLHPYIVDVKGMRSQYNAVNSVNIIEFQTAEEQQQYDEAWQRHLERKAKIDSEREGLSGGGRMEEWASFTIFRGEAEVIRAPYIAQFLHEAWVNGEAGVAACCFKKTISLIVKTLIDSYGYSRNDISLIWGGAAKIKKTKKKKSETLSEKEREVMSEMALNSGMSQEELDELLNSVEEEVEEQINQDLDPALRLGNQSQKERQSEIDKFQSGKTKFCIFTFKSGGVGLSLHHCDELMPYKVKRKKESGYYVEDDIKNCVGIRPRCCILTPTYSAIEMVQGLGRCPRLTSMSDTKQVIVFYKDTIEERVAATVSQKLKCLRKVVRQREHWEDIILDNNKVREKELKHLLPPDIGEPVIPDDEDDLADLDIDNEEELIEV